MLKLNHVNIAYKEQSVVEDVSLSLNSEEIVGIVGESGSGKSTLLRSIIGLLSNSGKVTHGEILVKGENICDLKKEDLRKIRGKEIAMIFQHAELSMDPLWTIGRSFYESIYVHQKVTWKQAMELGADILGELLLKNPKQILCSFPFQLSGGMCQRVAIAIAMTNNPKILLADEPTSALDVTVQSQVIDTIMHMRKKKGTAILIVSHNMGVIAQMADKVGVMWKGRLVEWGSKEEVLYHPQHAYTHKLIKAIPRIGKGGYYE